MDYSVISIEKTLKEFSASIQKRGFKKCRVIDLNAQQKTGYLKINYDLIGLLLTGEVALELGHLQVPLVVGEEFHIASGNSFQLIAGDVGAKVLYGVGYINC